MQSGNRGRRRMETHTVIKHRVYADLINHLEPLLGLEQLLLLRGVEDAR